jgi:hypothetical protein
MINEIRERKISYTAKEHNADAKEIPQIPAQEE